MTNIFSQFFQNRYCLVRRRRCENDRIVLAPVVDYKKLFVMVYLTFFSVHHLRERQSFTAAFFFPISFSVCDCVAKLRSEEEKEEEENRGHSCVGLMVINVAKHF